jgi:hypothetical protein
MGNIQPFPPSKLFIGIIYNDESLVKGLLAIIENEFGKLDLISEPIDFCHTSYYQKEMGDNLIKRFICIKELWNPENIYKAKLVTDKIENTYTTKNKRNINLDPGSLTLHNIILLSTKNFMHRIPLADGIYAELTLIFNKRANKYQDLPWTYPDYKTSEYQKILLDIRKTYKKELLN